MNMLKKILTFKVAMVIVGIVAFLVILIGIISAVTGVSIGYENLKRQSEEKRGSVTVINNQIYASRYRTLLNKHLIDDGYVSLERLVFYLQRTENVLDITELSNDKWESAYLKNLNKELKQMVPIKTICKEIKHDSNIPKQTIESGTNDDSTYIEVLNLCEVNGVDITKSDEYSEMYPYLPFVFPVKDNFSITSFVFEMRDVDLGLSGQAQERTNFHSGWDFATSFNTPFYSMCTGTIKSIVNTQFNDLIYKESQNSTGNYVVVSCNNGFEINYHHIKANSVPKKFSVGIVVREGDHLGQISTTGLSTGYHLHVGLKINGENADVMEYVDFNYKNGN